MPPFQLLQPNFSSGASLPSTNNGCLTISNPLRKRIDSILVICNKASKTNTYTQGATVVHAFHDTNLNIEDHFVSLRAQKLFELEKILKFYNATCSITFI